MLASSSVVPQTTTTVENTQQIETWNIDNIVQNVGWVGAALLLAALIGKGCQLVGWFGR